MSYKGLKRQGGTLHTYHQVGKPPEQGRILITTLYDLFYKDNIMDTVKILVISRSRCEGDENIEYLERENVACLPLFICLHQQNA